MGYSKKDSQKLKEEFERQAIEKYVNGDYQLGVLNQYGQRISIRIEIPDSKGELKSFITGWMVEKNGLIRNTTPFGG